MAKKKNASALIEAAQQEVSYEESIKPVIDEALYLAQTTQDQITNLKKKLTALQVPSSQVPELTGLSIELKDLSSQIKKELEYRDSLKEAYEEFAEAFGYNPELILPPSSFEQHEGRITPIYSRKICDHCGMPLLPEEFYPNLHICKNCTTALLFSFYESTHDVLQSLYKTCASLNIYYDPDLASKAISEYNNNNHKTPLIEIYLNSIPDQLPFSSSPILFRESIPSQEPDPEATLEERLKQIYSATTPIQQEGFAPPTWNEDDARNYRQVYRIFSYYPFENEENQKILCKDLLNLLSDTESQQDYVKSQSALRIVLEFQKLKELDVKISNAEAEGASVKEIKDLNDMKAKCMGQIVNFSRDSGFAQRYAENKSKGANTFTGILSAMNQEKFENSLTNLYDIKTSASIRQVADISTEAIINQITLSETQQADIIAKQLAELTKVRRELLDLEEQNRRLRYTIKQNELIQKAIENGVKEADII